MAGLEGVVAILTSWSPMLAIDRVPRGAMDLSAWLASGFFGLLVLGGTLLLPRLWRGQLHPTQDRFRWWLWGDPLLRGWLRTLPWLVLNGWVMLVFFGVAVVIRREETGPEGAGDPTLLVTAFLLWLALFVAVTASIVLVNHPKVVVPPPFRRQPGALSEWRGRRSPKDIE